jgi:poly(3-hydroxybutyrate) depolymerase
VKRAPCALALLAGLAGLAFARGARADLALAPGPTGAFAAWLVASPLRTGARGPSPRTALLTLDQALPPGAGAAGVAPRAGHAPPGAPHLRWRVLASPAEALDLGAAHKATPGEALALAGGVLRVSRPFKGYLLLGADDGVAAFVDGRPVFRRDEYRHPHRDADVVPLELEPGDHPIVLALHQRANGWELRARFTDRALAPARGLRLVLPGDVDAPAVAAQLAKISFAWGLGPEGYRPRATLAFPGGVPVDADRRVQIAYGPAGAPPGGAAALSAGEVPLEDEGPTTPWRVTLPPLRGAELEAVERAGTLVADVSVGAAKARFSLRPRAPARLAVARAERALAGLAGMAHVRDPEATRATLSHLADRLRAFADQGDDDLDAQRDEAQRLEAMCASLEAGRDLFASLRGPNRVAYRSPLDGKPSPFGLYVPADGPLDGSKRYPLVVALHGLNGKPMSMLRIFFGHDEGRSGDWKDRHPGSFENLAAFVVAPTAHGNAGYRDVGERDVAEIVAWAKRTYPIDEDRVSITGPSMGGTGTAAVAFRRADQFAAAAPLCGYHTWFRRQDVAGDSWRPWERDLLAQRSNFAWAENGRHLPLWIVHGTKDLPVENSGVLIDRYKRLGYSLLEEHPELGHNVWQRTYEGLKGYRWLASHKRDAHPTRIVWKTNDLRFARYAWLEIARLERSLDWGEARAIVAPAPAPGEARLELKTRGVGALRLARDPAWGAHEGPVTVDVDGARLAFGAGEPVALEREGGAWRKGVGEAAGLQKRGGLAGPIRDVFYEPLVVVYGTLDPALARANEEVARWFARVRGGVEIDYDVVADAAFDPAAHQGRALVLVGGPQSNALTRRLDERLPIHVTSDPPRVAAGGREFTGDELGAAFIYPDPERPDRYVVVIAGVDAPGTLRAASLPDMLPDFVVYDRRLAPARGQFIMAPAEPVWAGSFDERWALPKAP